ncbi:MAG: hypothetical protein GXO71_07790 [Caldiserica bacterium]|nr:hypothetical protein [Caldisericota bacterium]
MKKVAIFGVGFMGGSLALALKRKSPNIKIFWDWEEMRKNYRPQKAWE